ncbi:MAG: aminoglycoside phosphotransferase family protein [Proteobacteria bacterium]|nr:aminoglycoside phosphotransferase family protein [Pseudomonadota bacterium]
MIEDPEKMSLALLELAEPRVTACHGAVQWNALVGGRNNRAFRVQYAGETYVLKHYFYSAADQRDRRKAEADFLAHCKVCKISSVPKLLASSQDLHASLLSCMPGEALPQGAAIRLEQIQSAIGFFKQLQRWEQQPDLANAADAKWGLEGHRLRAESRLRRLQAVAATTPLERDMHSFVDKALGAEWERLRNLPRGSSDRLLDDPQYFERTISPSDFGFHNTLLSPDGTLRFLDFEYAGWDDPIKTILDFFFQPRLRVPAEFFRLFRDAVLGHTRYPEIHRRRLVALAPVFRVIWVCTILNEFLPDGEARRGFARATDAALDLEACEARKAAQLDKARVLLSEPIDYMT